MSISPTGPSATALDDVVELVRGWRPRAAGQPARGSYCIRLLLDDARANARRGDIIVGHRRSRFQRMMDVYGDPCTHVALVDEVDGRLVTREMGPKGCFSRSLDEFMKAYIWSGIVRPTMEPGCIDRVLAEAQRSLDSDRMRYSTWLCAIVGVTGLLRRGLPARFEEATNRTALRMARLRHRIEGRESTTCSGFVAQCLDAACEDCRPLPQWPVRARIRPWRGAPSATDVTRGPSRPVDRADRDAAVSLMSPTDIWVAVPARFKSIVGPGSMTALFDLRVSDTGPTSPEPPSFDAGEEV